MDQQINDLIQAIVEQPLVMLILTLIVVLLIIVIIFWTVWKIFQIRKEKRLGDKGRTLKKGKYK